MDWPTERLGDCCVRVQYGPSKKANDRGEDMAVLRMGNVTYDGDLDDTDLKHIGLSDAESARYGLQTGDILFNRTNSRDLVGKTGLWDGRYLAVAASYFVRLRLDQSRADPACVWAAMNSVGVKRRLFAMARGAIGQANINAKELGSIRLPVPPLDLQRQYGQTVETTRAVAPVAESATTVAAALTTSLVATLFPTRKEKLAEMDKFLAAVKSHARKVMNDSRNSNLFGHKGNRGLVRENVINGFLRPLLPSCYGLGTGEVFSTNGDTSRQIDIVVYDSVFSIAFFKEQDVQLFPCETVFGTIEVKSRMTSEELNKGVQNIRSVKRLKREHATCLDFLPMVNLPLGPGLRADRTQMNPYLGYICAYDGISATQATERLDGLIGAAEDRQHLPDFVFNLEQEYVVCRGLRQEKRVVLSQQGGEFNCFFPIRFNKEEVVMMLYLALNIQLNQTRLKATRLDDYWKSMIQQALTQGSF